jgi:hypothetical protein
MSKQHRRVYRRRPSKVIRIEDNLHDLQPREKYGSAQDWGLRFLGRLEPLENRKLPRTIEQRAICCKACTRIIPYYGLWA